MSFDGQQTGTFIAIDALPRSLPLMRHLLQCRECSDAHHLCSEGKAIMNEAAAILPDSHLLAVIHDLHR